MKKNVDVAGCLDCNNVATSPGTADTPRSRADDVTDQVRSDLLTQSCDSLLIVCRALPTGTGTNVRDAGARAGDQQRAHLGGHHQHR